MRPLRSAIACALSLALLWLTPGLPAWAATAELVNAPSGAERTAPPAIVVNPSLQPNAGGGVFSAALGAKAATRAASGLRRFAPVRKLVKIAAGAPARWRSSIGAAPALSFGTFAAGFGLMGGITHLVPLVLSILPAMI